MSKLNVLELNKNARARVSEVLAEAEKVSDEAKGFMKKLKELEPELMRKIEAHEEQLRSLSVAEKEEAAPVAAETKEAGEKKPAEKSPEAANEQAGKEDKAVAEVKQEPEQKRDDINKINAEIEKGKEPTDRQPEMRTEEIGSKPAKAKEKKPEPAKEKKREEEAKPKKSTPNISVFVPDITAFKPQIRVVRSAKAEELEQKKREEKQKQYKAESAQRSAQQRPPRDGQGRPPRPQNQRPTQGYAQGQDRRSSFVSDKDKDESAEQRRPQTVRRTGPGDRPALPAVPAGTRGRAPAHEVKKRPIEDEIAAKRRKAVKERVALEDGESVKGRKKKKEKPKAQIEAIRIENAVINGDTVSVKILAERIGKPVPDIIKKLMLLGMMCTINSELDFDTASLVAGEYNITLEQKIEQTAEDVLVAEDKEDSEEDLVTRPPVVTIMGHVDHGKTSLLDTIRKTKVQAGEEGGITQHIGAYTIAIKGKKITFLDTPGHEAFTAMRARGAQATDIAVLVVAADDGVMPQTVEAISHAKSAGVPIIVAINKMDKPGANPDRVKQELTEHGLVAEEWGGENIMVPVSALTGEGVPSLLEMILLVADVAELKANPDRLAKGTIIEARLDKGRGPVATVLVQNGTLKVQDTVVAGMSSGRVRAMYDDSGRPVKKAGPSMPVEVVGLSEVPEAGDSIYAVEQDKLSKQVVEERKDKVKAEKLKSMSRVSLDDLFTKIAEGEIKDLNIIVKADVQGSVEAVSQSLEKLSNSEVRVRIVHGAVGAISESDIMLASASNAIIIGFNVRPDAAVSSAAERENVDIRLYRVIYNAIEDVEKAMKGMLAPQYKESVLGHAEVRQTFKVSSVGTIAGCYVTDGKIVRNSSVRLLRNSVVLFEGKFSSLKRFKDDAREVASGYECGISIENYNDIKEGDVIESFEMVEVAR